MTDAYWQKRCHTPEEKQSLEYFLFTEARVNTVIFLQSEDYLNCVANVMDLNDY